MLWYAVIFICILAIALILQWNWLFTYERTRSSNVIREYIETLTPERIKALSRDSIDFIDTNIQSFEDAFDSCALPILEQELSYKTDSSGGDSTRENYVIFAGEKEIGRVSLQKEDKKEMQLHLFGDELSCWRVVDEQYDFSFLKSNTNTASITVPMEYSVECNGYSLGTRYITAKDNDYPSLNFLKDYGIELPYMATYTVNGFLGDVSFKVFDSDGNEVEETANYETMILNNCTEEECSRLQRFCEEYCVRYVALTGCPRNSNGGNVYQEYEALKPYLDTASEFAGRLYDTCKDMALYSNTKSNEVKNIVFNGCIKIGDGLYVCDVNYDNTAMGATWEYSTTRNYAHIFVRWDAGGVYTYDMIMYKNAEVIDG